MKKEIRISDCLDDMDEAAMDRVEPKMKSRFGVSNKKIKFLALSRIQGDKASVKTYVSRKFFRLAVAVTLAAMLLVTTAFAFAGIDLLNYFFGQKTAVFGRKTQNILAQDTKNGVTFTVCQAVNDGENAVITYAFTKVDGSAFDDNTKCGDFKFEGPAFDGYEYTNQSMFQDDKKTLIGNIKVEIQNITKDEVTISVDKLLTEISGKKVMDVDLAKLCESGEKIPLLTEVFGDGIFFKASLLSEKLYFNVTGSPSYGMYRHSFAQILYLENTSTGNIIYYDEKDGHFGLSGVSLSDYKPGVVYRKSIISVKGPWNVSVKFQQGLEPVTKTINKTVNVGDKLYEIEDVTLSMLGVKVTGSFKNQDGTVVSADDAYNLTFVQQSLVLKNGEKLKLYMRSGGGGSFDFNISDQDPQNYNNAKTLIDFISSGSTMNDYLAFIHPADVAAIVIGDITIPIQ